MIPLHIRVVRAIDRFTDFTGTLVAWLNVPLALAVTYEVVARYVFNSPTIWAYDVSYMLHCSKKKSVRTRGVIDSIAYLGFFFPSLILFLAVSWGEGWYAFTINEVSEQTPWRPILWPLKMVVPLTCLLLLIQGLSETIKCVYAARTGIELEHKEKIEV